MEIQKLDPKNIFPSTWATRTDLSGPEFEALKADIQSSGGNVVPIKVRPAYVIEGEFDIVYGHRRHQACRELGLDVLALVEAMNDFQLVTEMDRENQFRKDPSAYERGTFFAMALDRGLFPSARKMVEQLAINQVLAAKLLSLARLPKQILSAFHQPSRIKENWVNKIVNRLTKDPDAMLARARVLTEAKKKMTAAQIYSELTK